jgi:NAD(P)H-hydrate epimerase
MLRRLVDETMIRSVSAAEMKAMDEHTIRTMGIPSLVLMERAALGVVEALNSSANAFDLTRVVVVCGGGNNGGDGLAVARLLHLQGVEVLTIVLGDINKLTPECAQQYRICQAYEVPFAQLPELPTLLANATTIIDALLGIGADRPLKGEFAEAVAEINASPARVIAVDVPTGIADDASVLGSAVEADVTVTFAFPKRGILASPGRTFAGEIFIADIGVYDR